MNVFLKSAPSERLLTQLQFVFFGGAILFFARSVLIPLSFSLLISFVLYPICCWLERRGVGRLTAILVCVSLIMLGFAGLSLLALKQLVDFWREWPSLKSGLIRMIDQVSNAFTAQLGVSRELQGQWLSKAMDSWATNGLDWAKSAISISAMSAVMVVLVPVYVVLILYYRKVWVRVLSRLIPGSTLEGTRQMLTYSIQAYYNFMKGMVLVYLIVGVLNSIGLYLLGVPHALLFGILASLLTFIPYVGIMIGALLPIALAWSTHDSFWYPLGVVGMFTFVQYLEANIIFPFAVSNKLQINTLAVLLAIFLGGLLWGVPGMILFIPFMGMIKLIADHDPKMKTIALLLGTNQPNRE